MSVILSFASVFGPHRFVYVLFRSFVISFVRYLFISPVRFVFLYLGVLSFCMLRLIYVGVFLALFISLCIV